MQPLYCYWSTITGIEIFSKIIEVLFTDCEKKPQRSSNNSIAAEKQVITFNPSHAEIFNDATVCWSLQFYWSHEASHKYCVCAVFSVPTDIESCDAISLSKKTFRQ